MIIFKFWVLNVAALITIVAGTIKILDEHRPNAFFAILIILGATLLFIKTYNYCFHWGSEPKEKKKSKRKKKEDPIINFFKSIYDIFDYFFGWAVPFVVLYFFISIMIWATS
jgi:hypothetical protein